MTDLQMPSLPESDADVTIKLFKQDQDWSYEGKTSDGATYRGFVQSPFWQIGLWNIIAETMVRTQEKKTGKEDRALRSNVRQLADMIHQTVDPDGHGVDIVMAKNPSFFEKIVWLFGR